MPYRSWLFVPGDSRKKLQKISACGADVAIIDLEDSVAPERKADARELAAAFVSAFQAGTPELWVRINPVSAGIYRDDLDRIVAAGARGVVLPKPDSVDDVWILDTCLRELEARHGRQQGSVAILPIATESAAAVMNLSRYQQAPTRLWGLTWGAEDLATDLGAATNKDATGQFTDTFGLARSLCLLAATAAGCPAIDTVFTDFSNHDALRLYAEAARRDGFTGMLAIHPNQVNAINAAFTPSAAEIADAQAIVNAFATEPGAGVVSLDGKMLDRPHLRQAERILNMAAK